MECVAALWILAEEGFRRGMHVSEMGPREVLYRRCMADAMVG